MVDTGLKSMTGGRIKKLKKFIGKEKFMVTYGDGLSNVDINKLIDFHNSHGKIATVTAVRPSARFGNIEIKDNQVTSFQEKPQAQDGWINGGFFVFNHEIFDLIDNDLTVLEKETLSICAKRGELMSFKHEGFWQCMDTKRDKDYLETLWQEGEIKWKSQ